MSEPRIGRRIRTRTRSSVQTKNRNPETTHKTQQTIGTGHLGNFVKSTAHISHITGKTTEDALFRTCYKSTDHRTQNVMTDQKVIKSMDTDYPEDFTKFTTCISQPTGSQAITNNRETNQDVPKKSAQNMKRISLSPRSTSQSTVLQVRTKNMGTDQKPNQISDTNGTRES